MDIAEIPWLSNRSGKDEGAFIAFVARHCVWANYEGISEKDKSTEVPVVFMINRWDGSIGFPGGKVEKGENPIKSALRELEEEIGFTVDPSRLMPCVSHEFSKVSHLFLVESNWEELLTLQKSALGSQHYGTEVTGTMLTHLYNYTPTKGLDNFLKGSLAKSVKEELEVLSALVRVE